MPTAAVRLSVPGSGGADAAFCGHADSCHAGISNCNRLSAGRVICPVRARRRPPPGRWAHPSVVSPALTVLNSNYNRINIR
jgi:hypothetical protein